MYNSISELNEEIKSCTKCSLFETAKQAVCGSGNTNADIMIIAQNPGKTEDRDGLPLIGRSGRVLDQVLEHVLLNRDDLYITNVVKHLTPENRNPRQTEIKNCIGFLENEIDLVKPKIIITLGATPTFALIKEKAITKIRGSIFKYKGIYLIPTIHPAYVLRNPKQINNLIDDFNIAKKLLQPDKDNLLDYVLINNKFEARKYLDKILEQTVYSLDIETTGLSFINDTIIGIGFSYQEGKSFFIPIDIVNEVIDKLKEIFYDNELICVMQNGKFDSKFLKYHLGIYPKNFYFDTMLAHHLIDVNTIHNLKFMSRIFPDLAGYDEELKKYMKKKDLDKGSFDKVPIEKLKEYCCGDCDATRRLYFVLVDKLKRLDLFGFYNNVIHKLQDVLMEMEYNGNIIDFDALEKLVIIYDKKIREAKNKLYEIAETKTINLNSSKQLRELLFGKLGIEPVRITQKTQQPSTDSATLKELVKKGYKIAEYLLEYRKLSKMSSTYLKGLVDNIHNDGKVHTNYNLHITRTLRLSANDPNLQNQPRTNEIRNLFIPNDGYIYLNGDFSQLELRIMAFYSKDERMLSAFRNDLDIHAETGKLIFNKDELTVNERVKVKNVNFGVIYGIGGNGLMQQINDAMIENGLNDFISVEQAQTLINMWFDRYKDVYRWIRKKRLEVSKTGKVVTIFNTFRELPKVFSTNKEEREAALREAINTIIQETAAIYGHIAIVNVNNWIKENDLDIRMTLPVHDEVTFEIPLSYENIFDELKENISYIMTHNVVKKIEDIVPMKFDCKYIEKWGK